MNLQKKILISKFRDFPLPQWASLESLTTPILVWREDLQVVNTFLVNLQDLKHSWIFERRRIFLYFCITGIVLGNKNK